MSQHDKTREMSQKEKSKKNRRISMERDEEYYDSQQRYLNLINGPHERGAPNMRRLYDILCLSRADRSIGEMNLINMFIRSREGGLVDAYGNTSFVVGDQNPRVLWSAHTDTVDATGAETYKEVGVAGHHLVLMNRDHERHVLGADNGAGVWMLLEMMDAGVPGLYCFFRAEESGGLGSRYFVKYTFNRWKSIKAALAFDRKGLDSVITHQGSKRTCSESFAESLISILGDNYRRDSGGSFTDTKNFSDDIPECTNLSIGYDFAHTSKEILDMDHLVTLRNEMIKFDESKLIIERDPKRLEYLPAKTYYWNDYIGGRGDLPLVRNGDCYIVDQDDHVDWRIETKRDDHDKLRYEGLLDRVIEYPDIAAKMLSDLGVLITDFDQEVYDEMGVIYNESSCEDEDK